MDSRADSIFIHSKIFVIFLGLCCGGGGADYAVTGV